MGSKEPASTIERPNGGLERPPTVQMNDGLAVVESRGGTPGAVPAAGGQPPAATPANSSPSDEAGRMGAGTAYCVDCSFDVSTRPVSSHHSTFTRSIRLGRDTTATPEYQKDCTCAESTRTPQVPAAGIGTS